MEIEYKKPEWWIKNYNINYKPNEIAKILGVSIRKIIGRAYYLRKKGHNILLYQPKKNYCDACKKKISPYNIMGRKRNLCRSCSAKIVFRNRGSFIPYNNRKKMLQEEIDYIIKNYSLTTNKDLSKTLNRSESSIANIQTKFNLKKDRNFYLETLRKTGVLWTSKNNPMKNEIYKNKARQSLIKLYTEHPEKLLNANLKRDKMTLIEEKVEKILKKFNINYKWNKYVRTRNTWRFPDFRIDNKKLIIKCDGEYWHNQNKEGDLVRQKELEAIGYKVIRFSDKDILKNIQEVEKCIRQELKV